MAEKNVRGKGRILVIDDSLVIQRLVELRLRNDGYEVISFNNGIDGIREAKNLRPDVILLDIDMPIINGYDSCKRLKEDPETRMIPIIFLTAQATTADKVKGLDMGAVDYVAKPFDPAELRARVRSAHRTKYLLELLEQKAQIDGLTGLYNRAFFDVRLREEIDRARRYNGRLAVVIADVDKFKSINDTFGHSCGDSVLQEVGETLRTVSRTSDVVARYGGEEFVIILAEQCRESAGLAADRVRKALMDIDLKHNGTRVPISASFGVATTDEVGYAGLDLVNAADKSLYNAKQTGRNRVCIWSGTEPLPGPGCDGYVCSLSEELLMAAR